MSLPLLKKLERKKKRQFEQQKLELVESSNRRKEELLEHPVYKLLELIQNEHPDFIMIKKELTELEKAFYSKWGKKVEYPN